MGYSRRTLLTLLLGCAPAALADRSQAKRYAKRARKQAKRNKKLGRQEVADRNAHAKRRRQDHKYLNRDNAELDKMRRQDLADLTKRRQAHTKRAVFTSDAPAEDPKPGIRPATRGVQTTPEPQK